MTVLIFILILSILIVVHELGHFIVAKKMGVRVETFSLGFGPVIFRKKKGETEYTLSAIPLGGYVKLAGDSLEDYKGNKDEFLTQAPGRRFRIIFAGPLVNYILGFLCFWLIFFVGYPTLTTKIGGFVDGYYAKESGLKVNDKIIAVDQEKVKLWEDMQEIIHNKKTDSTVQLTVLRDNSELKFAVRIKEKEFVDQLGKKQNIGLLGITPADDVIKVKHGFLKSGTLGAKRTLELTTITYQGLWRLISGKISPQESVTGPLGIYFITSKAAKAGPIAIMHLFAILSISLAIFNLLPLPILDGGHIFFLIIEKIRGKALGAKVERFITQVGLSLIIFIAVFVTYNDIVRHFGDKIMKIFGK